MRAKKTLVVGITATPDLLEKLNCPRKSIQYDATDIRHYTEDKIIPYASIVQLIQEIPLGQKGALYVPTIRDMKKYEKIVRERGFNPICVWSITNEDHPMTEEQHRVREYVLTEEAIPDQYDFFILNASLETAINIRSHMDFFIIHAAMERTIIQARGRYRNDLATLYLLNKTEGRLVISEDDLDRPLFKEDKARIQRGTGLKNAHGNPLPWKDLKPLLTVNGYTIEEGGRIDNRPYMIIRKI